jgi:hypothetical protein
LCNLAVGPLQSFLQDLHVLLVLFELDAHFLDGAFLLPENLDGFSMLPSLFFKFGLTIADTSFQFADDATATGNSIGLDLFKAD